MKKNWKNVLLSFVLLSLAIHSATAAEYLVKDGKAAGSILTPTQAGPEIELAAKELAEHLQKMTGATLPVVADTGGVLPVGAIRLEIAPNAPKALPRDGSEQAFVLDQTGRGLLIEGNSGIGVLYGVYEYLSGLGVRWFSPGEIGTNIPQRKEIALDGTRRRVQPVFRSRQTDYSGELGWHFDPAHFAEQEHDYDLWMLRNRLQFYRGLHNGPTHIFPGTMGYTHETCGHNIRKAALSTVTDTFDKKGRRRSIPIDITKEPERFPLVTRGGKQERYAKGQICFTNRANIEAAVKWALAYFHDNPEMMTASMSLQDTGGMCECENCTRANGGVNPAVDANRVVWLWMNQVAEGVRAVMPDRGIAFYSNYGMMTAPPPGLKAAPNIVGVVCHIEHSNHDLSDPNCAPNQLFLQRLKALKASGAEMSGHEYSTYPISLQPLALLDNVGEYARQGCVWYQSETMARSEYHNIVMWAQAQLAWNPAQDPRKLVEEYCAAYYGAAGPDVLSVVDAVEANVRKVPKITLSGYGANQEILTDELITFGHGRLQAASATVTGVYAERLQRFRDTFEIFSLIAEATRSYYLALEEQSDARRLQSLAKFDEALAYWNQHNLNETCSPAMVSGWIERFRKTTLVPLSPVNPAPSKDLVDADEATLRQAVFPDATGKINDLIFLPRQWRFRVDPLRHGEDEGWTKADYDDARWPLLGPNTYDAQGFARYEGTYWYRTAFEVPAALRGKKIFLRFGALDDEGDIYLNGILAFRREHINAEDWKTPFEFDATSFLQPGQRNIVAVRGRNDYGKGGLWKPVAIYTK